MVRVRCCWFLLLLVGMGFGCGRRYSATSSENCTGSQCTTPQDVSSEAECVINADCAEQEECASGICRRSSAVPTVPSEIPTTCASIHDCAAGLYCNIRLQQCVQCLNNDACTVGQVCLPNGTCGVPQGCTQAGCSNGLQCDTVSNQCVQCLNASHCSSSQQCIEHVCQGSNTCSRNEDCLSSGRVCNSVTRECVACTSTAECGAGRTCSVGVCVADGSSGGGGLPPLPQPPGGASGQCQSSADCGGQACFLSTCMPCFTDMMCLNLMNMASGAMQICHAETGLCGPAECTTAADCQPRQGCYGMGHCGACSDDSECRIGQTCELTSGECR